MVLRDPDFRYGFGYWLPPLCLYDEDSVVPGWISFLLLAAKTPRLILA